jgi:hypothetical protein
MITLGLSKNFTGTEYFQASTTLHELGHTMELWHGGAPPTFGAPNAAGRVKVTVQENCKPNYQSSMSYLHQLYGLIDATASRTSTTPTRARHRERHDRRERDSATARSRRHRVPAAWYTPIAAGTLADLLDVPAATSHCDGSPLCAGEPATGRLQADEVSPVLIDWAGDGAPRRRRTSTSTASRAAVRHRPALQGITTSTTST